MNHLRLIANLFTGIGMGGRAAAYVLYFAARHLFLPAAIVGGALMCFGAGLYAGEYFGLKKRSAAGNEPDAG